VDELKNVLLPLNLAQALPQVYSLPNRLNMLEAKVDNIIANTRGLPGAHAVNQAVFQRLATVDMRTASQEERDKEAYEMLKKFGNQFESFQTSSLTNSQALGAIHQAMEKQAEAVSEAAWRRQNSVEQSTQTSAPARYVNSQVGTDVLEPGSSLGRAFTMGTMQRVASSSTLPAPNDAFTSPDAVEEELDSGPSRPRRASNKKGPSTMSDHSQAFAPGVAEAAPQPPTKPKLKRRAPAKKRAATLAATALDSLPFVIDDEDPFGPVPSLPPSDGAAPAVDTAVPAKKRKTRRASEAASTVSDHPRRIARERKSPLRWGQTPPSDDQDVLVPGTQSVVGTTRPIATLPKKGKGTGKSKGKGKGKATETHPEPMIRTTSTGQHLDLTADSLESMSSGDLAKPNISTPPSAPDSLPLVRSIRLHPPTAPQSAPPASPPATQPDPLPMTPQPSVVPETQLSDPSQLEPIHITRSATKDLDGQTRRAALFTQLGERLGLDDPLREAIEEEVDCEMLTGSQLLGFEDEEEE
jgi:hypothetical protein